MKFLASAFAAALAACASQPGSKAPADAPASSRVDTAANLEEALGDLERAFSRHDKSGALSLMDPEYKAKEHDDLFKGETEHFLNNFFCGKVVGADQYYCQNFAGITGIKRMEVEKGDGRHRVAYRVKTAEREIDVQVTVTLENGLVKGFIGSTGLTQHEK